MNTDLIRFVDSISRDKSIDKESVYADLEAAIESAARKAYVDAEEILVQIDRTNGTIDATVDGKPIEMTTLGRIAAQTAKQVMIQRIREDERSSIFEEYSERVGSVVTGTVTRYEGSVLLVNLGRAEAILPRSEQIPGEVHHPGERLRAMILDVREEQSQVRIVLTQTHPDYIRRLFELEVPEVGERIIEIRALAREAGYRTKVAVSSIDSKVDAVGACVGVRGSRIRNIVDELGGEKIDIVRWNESSQVLITNALKPAEVKEVFLCFELGRATVLVAEDQLSLAIGKRGQNVRLGARLTGWDIDILTPQEHDKSVEAMERGLKTIDGVEDILFDKLLAMGIISLGDITQVGCDPLTNELSLDKELAERIVEVAGIEAERLAEEAEAAKKAAALAAEEAEKQAALEEASATDESGTTESEGEPGESATEASAAEETEPQDVEASVAEDAKTGTEPEIDEQIAGESAGATVTESNESGSSETDSVSAAATGLEAGGTESSDPT